MSSSSHSPLLNIIARYSAPLERLASRMLVHKHRAADIVKWTLEAIDEEGKLQEGPQLRALLIAKTKDMAIGFNRAVEIHNELKQNGLAINHTTSTKPTIRH